MLALSVTIYSLCVPTGFWIDHATGGWTWKNTFQMATNALAPQTANPKSHHWSTVDPPLIHHYSIIIHIHHYSSTFGHGRRWKVASQVQWTEGAQQTQLERRNGDPGVPKIPGVPKSVEIFWLMSWEHLRTMFNMFKKGKNDVLKSEREMCFSVSGIFWTWNLTVQ